MIELFIAFRVRNAVSKPKNHGPVVTSTSWERMCVRSAERWKDLLIAFGFFFSRSCSPLAHMGSNQTTAKARRERERHPSFGWYLENRFLTGLESCMHWVSRRTVFSSISQRFVSPRSALLSIWTSHYHSLHHLYYSVHVFCFGSKNTHFENPTLVSKTVAEF